MLGMAANNSIAVLKIGFKNRGQSSVMNMAMPSETGTAITKANRVVINVPYRVVAAPKFSRTGSQAVLLMKPKKPKASMAKSDSRKREMKMLTIIARTRNAAEKVTAEKSLSRVCSRFMVPAMFYPG